MIYPLNPARPGLIIAVAITLGGSAIAIAIAPAARRRFHWPLVIAYRRLFLIFMLAPFHTVCTQIYQCVFQVGRAAQVGVSAS